MKVKDLIKEVEDENPYKVKPVDKSSKVSERKEKEKKKTPETEEAEDTGEKEDSEFTKILKDKLKKDKDSPSFL